MKTLQIAIADSLAIGGLGAFGFGLYRTLGLGICAIVVGVVSVGLGVMLDRQARRGI